MERRDLYNEKREWTGETIKKGEEIPKGKYYITVVVWIQNDHGEFLLQKRVSKKDGTWATTGGHPVSGETSEQGMLTEIKEELGLDVARNELTLFKTIQTEDDFVDLYYLKKNVDINQIQIQKEEVDEVAWNSLEEIQTKISNQEFSQSHAEFFGYCLEFLEK